MSREFFEVDGDFVMLINKNKIKAVTKDDNGFAEILLEGEDVPLRTNDRYVDILHELG